MNKEAFDNLEEEEKQSVFSRAIHSIRTRYSLATAIFLLITLGIFYIGGRIVLVHLMRESEQQVREIGYDISRLAYRNAERVRRVNECNIVPSARRLANGDKPIDIIKELGGAASALIDYSFAGEFKSGAVKGVGGLVEVSEADLAAYADRINDWIKGISGTNDTTSAVGLMQLGGTAHYVSLSRYEAGDGGYMIMGAPFESGMFSAQVNEGFSGLDIRVVNRKSEISVSATKKKAPQSSERNRFGIAPMISEAINFYSGGFWDIGDNPYEAVFAVRDISGNAVSMISVSLPSTLSTVTSSAIGRLAFFISIIGILLVLPVFILQNRLLLNPLTKMTQEIRSLGERHADIDCPRLEWKGKDEFAVLALSVNRMLETISARAIKVAQVESRHRALIAGVPDAMAVFDTKGRLVSISKQGEGVEPLTGFEVGEVPSAAVYGKESVAAFETAVAEVFETGKIGKIRIKVQRPAGVPRSVPTRHFEIRLSLMDDHFVLALIRDTTIEVAEHKRRIAAEQRGLDYSKRESLTLLAAGIAHDVNNVLSVILNSAETAWNDDRSSEVRPELETIRSAVNRGSQMTKELMAYAGDNRIRLVRTAVSIIVKDVQILAERVVGKNVILSCSIDPAAPDVDADPNQFWKVLFNIVKNAGEAIGSRPGNVRMSVSRFEMTAEESTKFVSEHPLPLGEGVLFEVEDDGPGVAPELLPRLFDPYVSSKSLGRGLGLATVRTIVEAHGGGMRVLSELDKGTTFMIYLPATRLPKEETVVAAPGEGKMPDEVLVVDNEEPILKSTSILLQALKVKAYLARERHDSLAIVRRYADRLGAIILDANLGGIDTVRLLEAFRIAAPHVPVIVSSGSTEEQMRKMFQSCPFDSFLGKPYTIAELKKSLILAHV